MAKLTYESQISGLDEVDSNYSGSTISRWSAEDIANGADNEIDNLKKLLKVAICYIQENDLLIDEIDEAISDD